MPKAASVPTVSKFQPRYKKLLRCRTKQAVTPPTQQVTPKESTQNIYAIVTWAKVRTTIVELKSYIQYYCQENLKWTSLSHLTGPKHKLHTEFVENHIRSKQQTIQVTR